MFDDNEMFQLGIGDLLKDIPHDKKREFNQFLKEVREKAKGTQCYFCGAECESFCNSHCIPRFILKNISVGGKLYHSNKLIELPILDKEKGLNNSGTFKIICRDCDSKIFSDYENPDNYSEIPSQKMLSQIALKNYLKNISKRQNEKVLYNLLTEKFGSDFSSMNSAMDLDMREFQTGYNYAKKALKSDYRQNYYIIYYEKLDYVVPLAFQNNLTLISDFEGNIINNIYNHSSDYVTKDIHICIFPLKDKSVILMFQQNNETRYRKFYKQFKKLSHTEKLKAINYIIFAYSEDIFMFKNLQEGLLQNEALKELSRQTTMASMNPLDMMTEPNFNALNKASKTYNLNKRNEFPNLLDKQYCKCEIDHS